MGGLRALDPPASQDPEPARRNAVDVGDKEGSQEMHEAEQSAVGVAPGVPGRGSGAPSTATARRRMTSPASWSTRLEQRERGKTRQAERGDTANGGASGYYRFS
ncbi:unnamed protein product, partial [Ectocarpus fasciculatus]